MNKLDNIKNILNDEGIDLEPYRNSDDKHIKKWIQRIECVKMKPSRRLTTYNQIKGRSIGYKDWYCSTCKVQNNSKRGYLNHMNSQSHKFKCGEISKETCPFCYDEIYSGTLKEHIEGKPFCRRAKLRKERIDYIARQAERDIELMKMNVDDPNIWYTELIDEYNRRLRADDGYYRDDEKQYKKNKLGLLVPKKLEDFNTIEEPIDISEDEENEIVLDPTLITIEELDEFLQKELITHQEYWSTCREIDYLSRIN